MTDAPATVSAVVAAGAGGAPRRRRDVAPLLVFAFAFAAVFFRTPSPLSALGDADGGQQLAGAQQIAFGEHPFVDFRSNYGPLTFYVTFVDQWLTGWRLGGELLWCTIAYALAYTLLFVVARWMTRYRALPVGMAVLAVMQLPRFYKYYILLGPAMTLAACLWYVGRPHRFSPLPVLRGRARVGAVRDFKSEISSQPPPEPSPGVPGEGERTAAWWRMLAVAASAVVTGLYRPDMGAYATVAAVVAVTIVEGTWSRRVRNIVVLGVMMLIVSSPWLIFLVMRHGLVTYLIDSTVGSATQAKGLALPFPWPTRNVVWHAPYNLMAYTFLVWWSLPMLGAMILLARWPALNEVLRRRAVVLIVLSALCLIQSAHRSDYNHLLQALAPSYVLAVFVASQVMEMCGAFAIGRYAVATVAVVLAGLSVVAGAATGSLGAGSIAVFSHYARYHFRDHAEFLRRAELKDPNNAFVKLTKFIDESTRPGERILAVPFMPTLYYFSGRPFAGRQMLLAPGYFSEDEDQRRLVTAMREQRNPMVIESTEGGGFDGIAARQPRSFAGLFYEYLDATYAHIEDPRLPAGYAAWRTKGGDK